MRNKITTSALFLAVFSAVFFIFIGSSARAWPGCCSRHEGVCGCSCCDGTSLSATCAPHYPECNSANSKPVNTPTPQNNSASPSNSNSSNSYNSNLSNNYSAEASVTTSKQADQSSDENESDLGTKIFYGALGVGAIAYFINKSKESKNNENKGKS